jgi:hemerythrin-like domain-containing protein
MDMSLGEQRFEAQMKLLERKIEQHVQEEENETFERAREVLSDDELDRLGVSMKALWVEQMSGEPTESLLEPSSQTSAQ